MVKKFGVQSQFNVTHTYQKSWTVSIEHNEYSGHDIQLPEPWIKVQQLTNLTKFSKQTTLIMDHVGEPRMGGAVPVSLRPSTAPV